MWMQSGLFSQQLGRLWGPTRYKHKAPSFSKGWQRPAQHKCFYTRKPSVAKPPPLINWLSRMQGRVTNHYFHQSGQNQTAWKPFKCLRIILLNEHQVLATQTQRGIHAEENLIGQLVFSASQIVYRHWRANLKVLVVLQQVPETDEYKASFQSM